jgi:hypothetical protein
MGIQRTDRVVGDGTRGLDLLAEARYHRHRYDVFRATMYRLRPMTMARLRELERVCRRADARLRRAQQAGAPRTRT